MAGGINRAVQMDFAPDGRLFVTEHSYDVRGSRPVWGTGDVLWRIEPGLWYGWPDFVGGVPVTDPRFRPVRGPRPDFVLANNYKIGWGDTGEWYQYTRDFPAGTYAAVNRMFGDIVIVGNGVGDRLRYPNDPPGDVQAYDLETEEPTGQTGVANGDIVRTVMRHNDRRVSVRIKYVDLRKKVGDGRVDVVRVVTNEGKGKKEAAA